MAEKTATDVVLDHMSISPEDARKLQGQVDVLRPQLERLSNREALARTIWKVKPDCFGRPFPPDTWDDKARRAYPHNPLASLDICYMYADAIIAFGRGEKK